MASVLTLDYGPCSPLPDSVFVRYYVGMRPAYRQLPLFPPEVDRSFDLLPMIGERQIRESFAHSEIGMHTHLLVMGSQFVG